MEHRPGNLLMVGSGHDSALWHHCTQDNITYLETNASFLPLIPANAVICQFDSKVGEWRPVPEAPPAINKPWDFIVVDGPPGYNSDCAGRQFPIAWAALLARKAVFVHDYDRPWELSLCNKYLGAPAEIIPAHGRKDRLLAMFTRNGFSPARKL